MTDFALPLFLFLLLALLAIFLLRNRLVNRQLPPLANRHTKPQPSPELLATTRLAQAFAPLIATHPGLSGTFPLPHGMDAFAARILLAEAAEQTLDVQYYIWNRDLAGMLLLQALYQAAERGVHVRLLLDDNNTRGMDQLLAALNSHPHIEVRLFNPFLYRKIRALGYLTDFERLNRRMHNKSFSVDRQACIIGGRNIGDEYLGLGEHMQFADLDVLAIGPVVEEVEDDFERYWNCESAYGAEQILPPAAVDSIAPLIRQFTHQYACSPYAVHTDTMLQSPFARQLLESTLPFVWTKVCMVSDDPAKGLGKAPYFRQIPQQLEDVIGMPRSELFLVSPYFVPTRTGTKMLRRLARRGVDISILTNSLESTDVFVVHAGYAKSRRPLLRAGITLFELKGSSLIPAVRDRGLTGSSASSLHAKTFSVDRERLFIGSFNFDPRSARLNTEMGFVIHSPLLAAQLADIFTDQLAEQAYRVKLSPGGLLRWREQGKDGVVMHTSEPRTSFWRRTGVRIVSWLPIEWLL
ncbi:MAG: phospholipase D family protein [Desulfobulbus sp.]